MKLSCLGVLMFLGWAALLTVNIIVIIGLWLILQACVDC